MDDHLGHTFAQMNLVTGSTGLLGLQVMYELLLRGEKVRGLKRASSDTRSVEQNFSSQPKGAELFRQIEWVEGDVLDVDSLMEAMTGCKHVYHCAAIVSYHSKDRDEMYAVNVEGTANVVNVALELHLEKLCFVSSIAALGKAKNNSWVHEDVEWTDSDFNTHYGITKNLSEMEVWRGIQEGLEAIVVNPGLIIGPGDFNRSSAALFSKINDGLGYYPPGGTGFIGVHDCAKSMTELMSRPISGERFILVSENLSMQEVFNAIADGLGVKKPNKLASDFILEIARIGELLKEKLTGKNHSTLRTPICSSDGCDPLHRK